MGFMEYVRNTYGVPAKRGMKVRYGDEDGIIVGATEQGRLRIRMFVNENRPRGVVLHVHPTDNCLKYEGA